MGRFSYVVRDKSGNIIRNVSDAGSKEQLIDSLHNQGATILSITEVRKKKGVSFKTKRGIKTDELVVFSRQFTTLIESGIPVVESLEIMCEQVNNSYFRSVLEDILKEVKGGSSLSRAFTKYPNVFPEIYISMVEAAEISGALPEILDRLAVYFEKTNALKKKITSAMYYPVIVLFIALGVTTFLLIKVVPSFQDIFDMLGGKLPLPTQILINISHFLRDNFITIVLSLVIVGVLFIRYINTAQGKYRYHRVLLNLPLLGDIVKKIAIAKFSRTFATLIRSGVSITECLEIVGKTSGNKVIEEAVNNCREAVQRGDSISLPLEETGIFPPMVVKMIAVGEKSGRLETMVSKIAQFYEEQTESIISGLSSIIEPLVIAFLGVVVGGIVIALFLPVFKISQYIGIG